MTDPVHLVVLAHIWRQTDLQHQWSSTGKYARLVRATLVQCLWVRGKALSRGSNDLCWHKQGIRINKENPPSTHKVKIQILIVLKVPNYYSFDPMKARTHKNSTIRWLLSKSVLGPIIQNLHLAHLSITLEESFVWSKVQMFQILFWMASGLTSNWLYDSTVPS